MVLPLTIINCNTNVTNTADDVNVGGKRKSQDQTYIVTNVIRDYDARNSPNFGLREEAENNDPLTPLNKSIRKKLKKDQNNEINHVTMITFDNSIKETKLHKEIGESENAKKDKGIIDELLQKNKTKLMNKLKQSNINMSNVDPNVMKCGDCLQEYKKKKWFIKHIREQKCLVSKRNKKNRIGNNTAGPSKTNNTARQCDQAGPSTSNCNNSNTALEENLIPEFNNNFKNPIKSMNAKTLEFKSTGDEEFKEFVKIARSKTTNAKNVNTKIVKKNMKKLHGRIVKLGVYLASPLRVVHPVNQLDLAFRFVLTAMGKGDLSDSLSKAARDADYGPYKLIISYMKAFIVNANTHCFTKSSMVNHVMLKEANFLNNVFNDASCSDLFEWKSQAMDSDCRHNVRLTVEHMFKEWKGARLESHLLCQQYEYWRRKYMIELSFQDPRNPRFECAKVPDVADPDFTLLRSFCVTGYSAGYLDFLRQSLFCFALPFLELVAESFVASGGLLNEAVVLASVRRLNIAWFQTQNQLYQLSGLYEHRGFDDVQASLRHIEAEQVNYANKAREIHIGF